MQGMGQGMPASSPGMAPAPVGMASPASSMASSSSAMPGTDQNMPAPGPSASPSQGASATPGMLGTAQGMASSSMPPSGMPAQETGSMQKMVQIGSPKFSPDGRWIAYCSNESGKAQVYVQSFPQGPKIQVSSEGGTDPVWKRKGGELYYRDGDKMMAVTVSTSPTFSAERPHMLWEGHYSHGMSASCGPAGATSSNYDVTGDGQRFLMIRDSDQDTSNSRQIVVIRGWADEVTRIEKSKSGQV